MISRAGQEYMEAVLATAMAQPLDPHGVLEGTTMTNAIFKPGEVIIPSKLTIASGLMLTDNQTTISGGAFVSEEPVDTCASCTSLLDLIEFDGDGEFYCPEHFPLEDW